MKTFKKVLGVVLTIAMLAGVFSMMASALAPDTAVDLFVSTDKAVYAPGDIVTITVSEQIDPLANAMFGDARIAGQYCIGYPSAVLENVSTSTDLKANHGFTILCGDEASTGYDNGNSGMKFWSVLEGEGDYIESSQASLWDADTCLVVVDDGASTIGSCADKTDLFSFQMKIKDTAADGTYTIGFNQGAYAMYIGYSYDIFGDDDDNSLGVTKTFGYGTCTFTVGSAVTGPEVNFSKAQVKKDITMSGTTYEVGLRITSVITDSDFDTYFPNTTIHGTDPAPTADALTSVGIVAFHGATADFDEAAAKALVIDGTAATGYEAAETDYISKANDTADAYFGAILRGSRAAFENKPVTFMGFAKYIDSTGTAQVIFYPAAVEKTVPSSLWA